MTADVSANYPLTMFLNNGQIPQDGVGTYVYFRSLNTQEWIGPFPLGGNVVQNERYVRFFVDHPTFDPDFKNQHRNGFYQYVVYVDPFLNPPPEPSAGNSRAQGLIKLIFDPGGEMNTKPYISNNEQRESDTYFRPNY